ncbi:MULTISPECIES: TVP38/TMEM64 family protein [unclassified Hydrogenophaga]|uniref:TVP38/TMEM64 family protein n=1 Tax=unclassified Hydrogenophaga TaxID=2610897 RepID=UPI000A863FD4|nr:MULTISPECIES: VTT domain-containing protein [unclassified Hydrogenophaga]MBN9371621.1 VTT domain-containing protein [Hydrogenophaga sp.]
MKTELRFFAKPLLLTAALSLAFVALHEGWLGAFTEKELLHALFLYHWGIAWPAFVAIGVVYTALGGPRQVLAFSSGYLLGGWQGALVSTLITGLGALLTMVVARYAAGDWLRRQYPRRVEALRQLMAEDTWKWVCILRLLPVGSNLATNIVAGLSGLDLRPIVVGSLLGYLPQMLLFAYAGSGLALHNSAHLWISLATLAASTALGVYLYRHGFRQRLERLRGEAQAQ